MSRPAGAVDGLIPQFNCQLVMSDAGVERFEEYGAEQWFGLWTSAAPSG
ncbi:hypothetical protein [Streptomyces aureus]